MFSLQENFKIEFHNGTGKGEVEIFQHIGVHDSKDAYFGAIDENVGSSFGEESGIFRFSDFVHFFVGRESETLHNKWCKVTLS